MRLSLPILVRIQMLFTRFPTSEQLTEFEKAKTIWPTILKEDMEHLNLMILQI